MTPGLELLPDAIRRGAGVGVLGVPADDLDGRPSRGPNLRIRWPEKGDGWYAAGGGKMGDSGIVPDIKSGMAHDAGQEPKAEVVEREEARELQACAQTPEDIVVRGALNQPEAEPGLLQEPADEGNPARRSPDSHMR